MSVMEELSRLQELHTDLLALCDSKLANIDRLWHELELQVEEFRKLLDRSPQTQRSRDSVLSGSIDVNGIQFAINEDFRHDTISIADILQTDEVEVAKLYLDVQSQEIDADRSRAAQAIILYHQKRQYLVDCLRLSLEKAAEPNLEEEIGAPFRELITLVLARPPESRHSRFSYYQKCMNNMSEIEAWLHKIADRAQTVSITGQNLPSEVLQALEFQKVSLFKQHESLGAVLYFLVKLSVTHLDDFRVLLARARSFDRYDGIVIHYMPVLLVSIAEFGASEALCSREESLELNECITASKEHEQWSLRPIQAAAAVVWEAEFFAREIGATIAPPETGRDAEMDIRLQKFMDALKDGAFHFLLRLCQDTKDAQWPDLAQLGLTSFFVNDAVGFQTDPFEVEGFLHDLMMIQIQAFVESFITNMPDALRRLRHDEDEQRRQILGRAQLNPSEYDLHFERFLTIVSYAYDGFPEAAQSFWADTDGSLFGFLHWASQRQSTPRVAAFCEMLRSLSIGHECASAAHDFLLDDGPMAGAKLRRHAPLSWTHILKELEYYAVAAREKPSTQNHKKQSIQVAEVESSMMLESYLRLITRLCRESTPARTFVLSHPSMPIHEYLLLLCSSSTENRLRACAFEALGALLTQKSREVGDALWSSLDSWITGTFTGGIATARQTGAFHGGNMTELLALEFISTSSEEPIAFVNLLKELITPPADEDSLNDEIPFPENLGAAYRMPGIDPYVDFVFGQIFARKLDDLQDAHQLSVLRLSCLEFATTSLATFNESLVVFANRASVSIDAGIKASSLAAYVRLHPVTRTMEWFFNEEVISILFSTVDCEPKDLIDKDENSSEVLCILRSIQVIHLVLSLQSTFFDVIRPLIKLRSSNKRHMVANTAMATFEDAILNHWSIVGMLVSYCSLPFQNLKIESLRLLQRLVSSRKLALPRALPHRRGVEKSYLVAAFERANELGPISGALMAILTFHPHEIEAGPSSPGIEVKRELLHLLDASLETTQARPSAAHALLGFVCYQSSLGIADEKAYLERRTLFHALLDFALLETSTDSENVVGWLTLLKYEALVIIQRLLLSPVSSELVGIECRNADMLGVLWSQQIHVRAQTTWDGSKIDAPEFLLSNAVEAYTAYLKTRQIILEFAAMELRVANRRNTVYSTSRIRSTIFGNTTLPNGQSRQHLTVFDLAEHIDIQGTEPATFPVSAFFSSFDFNLCRSEDQRNFQYNIEHAEQLISLRQAELSKTGRLVEFHDRQQFQADAENIVVWLHVNNCQSNIMSAQLASFKAWAQTAVLMLELCEMEVAAKHAAILRLLQIIVPQLERSYVERIDVSLMLANLGRVLVHHLHEKYFDLESGDFVDVNSSKTFQLFAVALLGIQCPQASSELRDSCYIICQQYLQKACMSAEQKALRKHSIQCVKSFGSRLIELVCDDACSGEGEVRASSLLLLGRLASVFRLVGSNYLLECFSRLNFFQISIDMIKDMFKYVVEDISSAHLAALLALILGICQTKRGASFVMNAGIFNSIRESRLFVSDSETSLDTGHPQAMGKYYMALLSLLRIINALILCQGTENDHVMNQAQLFLQENRSFLTSLFRRESQFADISEQCRSLLNEVVENITILAGSGFIKSSQSLNVHTEQQSFT